MKYLHNIILALSVIVLFSCQDNDDLTGSGKTGYLRLTVANDASTVTRADVPSDYNAEQIAVQIVSATDGSTVWSTDDWSSVEDEPIELSVGTYTIVASSYNWDGEASAFDAPYYTGTADITISSGVEVSETVTCTLANVKVTVNYDSELLAAVQSVATTVKSSDGIYQLNFSSSESRSGYFPVTTLEATVTVVNNDGDTNTLTQSLGGDEGVSARDHFILNIKPQETGKGNINVTVDPTTQEYEYTFRVSITSNGSATLQAMTWDRLAYLTAEAITVSTSASSEGLKFQYRAASSGDDAWTDAEITESTTTSGKYMAFATGLSANTEYEYRLVNGDGDVIQVGTNFTTGLADAKTALYNGDFEYWTDITSGTLIKKTTYYPNESEDVKFWDTSNTGANTISSVNPTSYVTSPVQSGTYAAKLESQKVLIAFAAASLSIGEFGSANILSQTATLDFGKEFTSRPIALHGYYIYNPVNVDNVGDNLPADATVSSGSEDDCAIYIALSKKTYTIDNGDTSTFIDFEDDDNIIAYGELPSGDATASSDSYTEFSIPLKYKESQFDVTPSYIILVCSASKYGDYMTGGSGSTLYVDDFSLVYDGVPTIWEK